MENHRKKILVTGALGLLGNLLANQLSGDYDVTGIDNDFRPNKEKQVNFTLVQTSVKEFVESNQNCYDYIFHFSAINGTKYFYEMPNQLIENNTCSDIEIFNYAKSNNSKVIYASTSEVVSDTETIPTPEEKDVMINNIHNPRWSYRLSKILSENYLYNSDLNFLIVRFFNIYSENSKSGHFIFDIVEKIKNKNFTVTGSNETRSFCYVDDAIDAVLNIFEKADNEIVNVGNDEEILIMDAVNIISSYYDKTENWNFEESRAGSTLRRSPCINKLREYYPTFSPITFNEGIKKVLDHENF